MADFLEEVSARTRERVAVQKQRINVAGLRKRFHEKGPARAFAKALHKPRALSVIAEIKQASPSAGVIRQESNMAGRVRAYERGGASALSILTEEDFFHGSPHMLEEARQLTHLPLLRKDFIIDPYQIDESKSLGADAILLITSLWPGSLLRDFMAHAEEIGLETLVEIHDEKDLEQALAAQAYVLGINNRNLRTLRVDVSNAERLLTRIPPKGMTLVVESGIKSPAELPRLKVQGAHAVLIGETLMRSEDPEKTLKEFVDICQK